MYEEFYGFTAPPFRLTPDNRFYFGSEGHRKAMSYLHYGLLQGEGFIVITGEVGTGKSTLVGQLLDQIDDGAIIAAQIGTTQVEAADAIELIVHAFRIPVEGHSKASFIAAFEEFLRTQYEAGRRVLLIVDEAQNLPYTTLEELRMLSNLNVDGEPLFQCFLVGQPQFLRVLADPELAQLQQRVIASYRLRAMSAAETRNYIEYRLTRVGWTGVPQVTDDAFAAIHAETKGVPRRINTLANRIMLYGALEERTVIDGAMVKTVIDDLHQEVHAEAGKISERVSARTPLPGLPEMQHGHMQSGQAPQDVGNRLERIEEALQSHDKALRELIETATGYLAALREQQAVGKAPAPVAEAAATGTDAKVAELKPRVPRG